MDYSSHWPQKSSLFYAFRHYKVSHCFPFSLCPPDWRSGNISVAVLTIEGSCDNRTSDFVAF
eukprot:3256506-Karenia_brevis.AAC.1